MRLTGSATDSPPRPRDLNRLARISFSNTILTVFAFISLIALASSQAIHPEQPIVCSTQSSLSHFRVPDTFHCPTVELQGQRVERALLTSYKRNLEQYRSIGYYCRKVRTTIKTYASFFNTNQKKDVPSIDIPVSREDCDKAVKYQTTSCGPLQPQGEASWVTSNKVYHDYHPFFHCCRWYEYSWKIFS